HFMFGPNQVVGCDGCSMFVDQIGHLAHLHARDTSFALVSRAPICVYQDGESFGLSVFIRDDDSACRTYFTTHRGVEALGRRGAPCKRVARPRRPGSLRNAPGPSGPVLAAVRVGHRLGGALPRFAYFFCPFGGGPPVQSSTAALTLGCCRASTNHGL